MAVRTTSSDVQSLLEDGGNYDAVNSPSLTKYILMASKIVDRVFTCANNKGITLDTDELELIERNLAAHYYTRSDPMYSSRSTAGASGSFVRPQGDAAGESYKQNAIELDYSGCLKAIFNRSNVRFGWLGKRPSDQIPYDQRD